MKRAALALLLVLAGCNAPAPPTALPPRASGAELTPEAAANVPLRDVAAIPDCLAGAPSFTIDIYYPEDRGTITAMTQYAFLPRGLEPVCPLTGYTQPLQGSAYEIYDGEVLGGTVGLCVRIRTSTRLDEMACADVATIRAAVAAPFGTPGAVVRLDMWEPYRRFGPR